MKNKKKEILINKYSKIKNIKNLIKNNLLKYFIQNNNLNLSKKSIYNLLQLTVHFKKKKNICLLSSRKRGINKYTNLSRLSFRRLARFGFIDNFKIN